MNRKKFVRLAGALSVGSMLTRFPLYASSLNDFPEVRVPLDKRKFSSEAF